MSSDSDRGRSFSPHRDQTHRHSNDLDDHRQQQYSLLEDHEYELSRIRSGSSRRSARLEQVRRGSRSSRTRKNSFGEGNITRVPSRTISESFDDEISTSRKRAASKERRSSRRVSTVSKISDDDSLRSMHENTDEDVCFPMSVKEQQPGVDFTELDNFVESTRQAANQSYVTGLEERGDDEKSIKFSDEEKEQNGGMDYSNETEKTLSPATIVNAQSGQIYVTPADITRRQSVRSSASHRNEVSFGGSRVEPDALEDEEEPLRFSYFGTEAAETIHASDLPSLVEEGQSFEDLFHSKNGVWWLDCLSPTDNEMKTLAKAFGIHPLTTEDIRTEESREKVELFKKYYFVSFHTFEDDSESEDYLELLNFYIVVFREGILSFHFTPIPNCSNVRRRVRQLRDYVSITSDWLCYALLDDITDCFAPIIHEVQVEADMIEDSVFIAKQQDIAPILRHISDTRKITMTLIKLLSGKAGVIKMFAKRCNEHWDRAPNGEIGLYLGDIQDHIVTMYQDLTMYEKILSRSHSNFLAQLQVENVASTGRVTSLLGKATMIGTILVPMNLITGMFGMNVRVPGENGSNLGWFFAILGIILLLISVFAYFSSWYLGTLERRGQETSALSMGGESIAPNSRDRRMANVALGTHLKRFRIGRRGSRISR